LRRSHSKQKRTPRPEHIYFLFSRGLTAGTQFKAIPIVYGKRERAQLGNVAPVYIEASNETLAHVAAIRLYRMMQIPVRFVRIEEYKPWEDDYLLAFGFVRRIN